MQARVVSAFVPLEGLRHFEPEQYHDYAGKMGRFVPHHFFSGTLPSMWLFKWLTPPGWTTLPPSTPAAPDRYPTPQHFVNSNMVQHNRTTWLLQAAMLYPKDDIFIWLDYGLLKQGDFTGKRIKADHVARFVEKVQRYYDAGYRDIPFPGIDDRGPINVYGNNWRFCGSTHVVPRWHLVDVHRAYRRRCCEFIVSTRTIPLDLPIWSLVEQGHPELPYRQYKAEYDYTQLENFPEP